ncbi:MAG: acetyl-CoA carboxylase biotin carboxylase subunit [Thermoguttaceae bacterium]|nr:acetyl-CoA carboxylase biotin carboxylase subunit [Thermoguttaceae bacterium]MBQ2555542.1 acetyl-CoA carboxylase biotin carboxylase subunit [Thermoguttaceae bacterium]MBQ3821429.1 acetyl-CoA carboxylase biotin carboxylase subunit [Thermoguttaceae bacterium]
MFKRILIANRGEIALRVIRACRELGVESVVAFSEADRDARYVQLADRAVCIGPARSDQSYLKVDRIISAAEVADVDAIHPGYGFLSENSHFAEKCRDSGYEFIGPTVEAMERLGDKNAARAMAKECGVPIVPGSDGLIETESQALACARKIGYPVLVKASAGGGGRGIRQANDDRQLRRALQEASREAATAFGVADVYIEKFIENPRHVEAQLLADNYGNAIHLWERDCSIQRRRQKLVELTPAPAMTLEKRKALCESAVRIAKAAGYTNAGTVEFIVDSKGDFYFIEMNARIQVEHPVTEMATGIDLIQQQIRIASGEKLEIRQEDVVHRGFAMECRINAEDAEHNFRPSPGKIELLVPPGGFGVRFDSHAYSGYSVSPYYDSMIGKLIVQRATREEGVATMIRALEELEVKGVKTSVPLLLKILKSEEFANEVPDVGFLERYFVK